MSVFKDSTGREWTLALTMRKLRLVRQESGVDLGTMLGSEKGIGTILFEDPLALGSLLWSMVRDQAVAAHVSQDDFEDAMDAMALEAARTALAQCVVDFFLGQKGGASVKEALTRSLSELDQNTAQFMKSAALSGSAGSTPESSVSTAATSLSGK